MKIVESTRRPPTVIPCNGTTEGGHKPRITDVHIKNVFRGGKVVREKWCLCDGHAMRYRSAERIKESDARAKVEAARRAGA